MAPFTQIAYIPKQKGYFIAGNETDAYRSTDTKNHTRIFLLLWGIWLNGGGLLCALQQSTGLYFYPLNYTALLSYAVHFTEN